LINFKEIKNKILKKENLYYFLIIFFIFSIDRYSKTKVTNELLNNALYINDFINFDLVWNTGIGFGLLSFNSLLIYNLISTFICLILIFLIYLAMKADKFDKLIFSIIIGGAIGNFYDRIFFNAVPDFIDLHIGNFHWFTFNVADIFITLGILAFIMKGFFVKNN
tara:strand:+ start:294 stop:788 length:495 start_codon:yes stop_codon:yes gene_type:complete